MRKYHFLIALSVIALDAVATGKTPEAYDLISPGPYTI